MAALERSAASRRLRRICLKALSPEPADRHANAEELAKQLDSVAKAPRRVTTLALCAIPIVLLLSLFAFRPWSQRVPSPPALFGADQDLVVHIEAGSRPSELREALPLRNGDLLWLTCKVPHATHRSMFWFDSEGGVTELTPEVVPGEAADLLKYPPSGVKRVVPLQGPPGTEFVLVCAAPRQAGHSPGNRSDPQSRGAITPVAGPRDAPSAVARCRTRGTTDFTVDRCTSGERPVGSTQPATNPAGASSKMTRPSFRESPSRTRLINRLGSLIDGGSLR